MSDDKVIRRTDLLAGDAIKSNVTLWENVLSKTRAKALLEELSCTLPFQVETDDFGPQSRATCFFGDSSDCVFAYVGLTLQPHPWPPIIRQLRDRVVQVCQLEGELTACLVNYYPENEGHIPWHYDEVRAHGDNKTVASLSLGGPRRFQLRKRSESRALVVDLLLPSGSVLLMQGSTQEDYEHCLPLDNQAAPARISLTFRSIVPGWEIGRKVASDTCCSESSDNILSAIDGQLNKK